MDKCRPLAPGAIQAWLDQTGADKGWIDFDALRAGGVTGGVTTAGAYTRPLFSST